MIKIRKLKSSDLKKSSHLNNYTAHYLNSNGLSAENNLVFPTSKLYDLLPLDFRFSEFYYAAIEDDQPRGIISIRPDESKKRKWVIKNLHLEENNFEIGKKLIDFVVNKYGAEGVESFFTYIKEDETEVITLFQNGCGFRNCSHVEIWQNKNFQSTENLNNELFRSLNSKDKNQLYDLYQQSVSPQYKMYFTKDTDDFEYGLKKYFFELLKNRKIERFVIENPLYKTIEALIELETADFVNFNLNVTISLAYQDYFEDILAFITNKILNINSNVETLNVYLKNYYQSSKKCTEILTNKNFKKTESIQILVKDYWKPQKVKAKENKSPIIIFPEQTSPACNALNYSKSE